MSSIKKLKQTGDTIIEVMVCMAIAGAAISAAYSISNRSLNRVRQSQERTEALKLAEQQAERLKALLAQDTTKYKSGSGLTARFKFYKADPTANTNMGDLYSAPTSILGSDENYIFCIDSSLNLAGPLTAVGQLADETDNLCREPAPQDPYKSIIVYNYKSAENLNKFYIYSGRFTVNPNESFNTNKFDVITLMLRMNP